VDDHEEDRDVSISEDIREGMQVYGTDHRLIGTIEKLERDAVTVNGERIPMSSVDSVAKNRVYVKVAGAETLGAEGEIRVPVMEERLDVTKRQAEQGEVTIRKTVEQEQVSAPVELRREEVHIEQRDTDDRPADAAGMADAFQEGTIRVPVRGEEAVVTKQAYQTGEVVIDKEQAVERRQVTDTVRRERVEVDEDRQVTRADEQQPTTTSRAAQADRTVAEAESEPRPRQGQTRAGGDAWEELKEDVREASDRTRGK
jgi:uncharacterized protein (TIGR02271 family)